MKIKLFTIPNLLTLSNLLCGMIATVAILTDGDLHLAFWLLVLAAVFDFFFRRLHGTAAPPVLADRVAARFAGRHGFVGRRTDGRHAHAGMAGRQFVVGGRYGRPLELDRTAAGRRDGVAAGEIQHRRHAAYRVLRTAFARGGTLLRLAGSAPRQKGCSRCPMKPYCSPRRRRPGS